MSISENGILKTIMNKIQDEKAKNMKDIFKRLTKSNSNAKE